MPITRKRSWCKPTALFCFLIRSKCNSLVCLFSSGKQLVILDKVFCANHFLSTIFCLYLRKIVERKWRLLHPGEQNAICSGRKSASVLITIETIICKNVFVMLLGGRFIMGIEAKLYIIGLVLAALFLLTGIDDTIWDIITLLRRRNYKKSAWIRSFWIPSRPRC